MSLVTADAESAFHTKPASYVLMKDSSSRQRQLLRRRLRDCRRRLDQHQRAEFTHTICSRILRHQAFKTAKHIGFYSAFDGEIDLTALLLRGRDMGKQVYLPVLPDGVFHKIRFAPCFDDSPFRLNRFGIPEPACDAKRLVTAVHLDLVLMPLVGFDESGQRLGMGGGFYDRCLEFRMRRRVWRKPFLLGVAYECQKVDSLASASWDVRMDACVTEACWYRF